MSNGRVGTAARAAGGHRLDVFRKPLLGRPGSTLLRGVDRVLRGTGQVVFQSNWLTGVAILVAIFYNSVP